MVICVFLRGERCGLCVAVRDDVLIKVNSGSLRATVTSACRSQAHPAQARLGESPGDCISNLMYLHRWSLAQSPADQVGCWFTARVWSHSSSGLSKTVRLCSSLCPNTLIDSHSGT